MRGFGDSRFLCSQVFEFTCLRANKLSMILSLGSWVLCRIPESKDVTRESSKATLFLESHLGETKSGFAKELRSAVQTANSVAPGACRLEASSHKPGTPKIVGMAFAVIQSHRKWHRKLWSCPLPEVVKRELYFLRRGFSRTTRRIFGCGV